jgi:hypothetical protein
MQLFHPHSTQALQRFDLLRIAKKRLADSARCGKALMDYRKSEIQQMLAVPRRLIKVQTPLLA